MERDDLKSQNSNQFKVKMINQTFLKRYLSIPNVDTYKNYYNKYPANFWNMSRKQIAENIALGEDGINFIWDAMLFNLFSKTTYEIFPENYTYYNDYITWKYNEYHVMEHVYKSKFKNMIDEEMKYLKSEKLHLFFYLYSLFNMNKFVKRWIRIFEEFNNQNCTTDNKAGLEKIIGTPSFQDEFSTETSTLSYTFYLHLKLAIIQ